MDNGRRAGIITISDYIDTRPMSDTTPYTALLEKAQRAAVEAGYDLDAIEQKCADSEPLQPLEIPSPERLYGGVIAGIQRADEDYRRARKPAFLPDTHELARRSEFVSLKTVAVTAIKAIEALPAFHKITDVKLLEEIEEALWRRKAVLETEQARSGGRSR